MDLTQRIERLERKNRWFKGMGLLVLIGLALVFLMGQAYGVPEEIKASKFLLVDEEGEMQGAFLATDDGPMLVLEGVNISKG